MRSLEMKLIYSVRVAAQEDRWFEDFVSGYTEEGETEHPKTQNKKERGENRDGTRTRLL